MLQGSLELAEVLLKNLLATDILDETHWQTLACRSILASIFVKQGRFEEAEVLLQKLLPEQRKTGYVFSGAWETTLWLCKTLEAQGKWEETVVLLLETAKNLEQLYGINHGMILVAWMELGHVFYHIRRFSRAEMYFRKYLDACDTTVSAIHRNDIDILQALHALGSAHYQQRKFSDAVTMFQKSLAIQESLERDIHCEVKICDTICKLGRCLFHQGNYIEAQRYLRRAVAIHDSQLEESRKDEDILTILGMPTVAMFRLGQYSEMEQFCCRALKIQESLDQGSSGALNMAVIQHNLGRSLFAQCRYAEAEKVFSSALQGKEAISETRDPDLVNIQETALYLYRTLVKLHKEQEALDLKERYKFLDNDQG